MMRGKIHSVFITVKRWAYIKQAPIKGTVAWDDFLLNPSRPGWKKDLNIFDLGQQSPKIAKIVFKGSDQWKIRGVEKLANVRRLYQTVAIDVCLFFYETVIFSVTYFRFLFVKLKK